jgi:hypothetical protein
MERPVELAPDVLRELLCAGVRRGVLLMPMTPQPVVEDRERRLLAGALLELGRLFDIGTMDDPVELLDAAFRDGVLPELRCPHGRPGDVLWCREPHALIDGQWRYSGRDARKGDAVVWAPAVRMPRHAARGVLNIDDVGIARDESGRFVWRIEVEVRR